MKRDHLNADNIISQDILHEAEALCTAEEPAACTAACPLHIDGRELCRLLAAGDGSGAYRLYQKAAPFARLLAYTCPGPCEQVCQRRSLGGAIRLPKLERTLAEHHGKPVKAPAFLLKKPQRVAVVGGGLRGLSAAHDLAKKGYRVTILEKSERLGGWLNDQPPAQLPPAVLAEELAIIAALDITVAYRQAVPLTDVAALSRLLTDYDGVYVACDAPFAALADQATQQLPDHERLLAGPGKNGWASGGGSVYEIYDGRSAAATLDRLFQQVNLRVGREKEGGFATTLITNFARVETQRPVPADPVTGYSMTAAEAEAARCIQCRCGLCVDKCGFLQEYGKTPRAYIREVYNNLSIAMGTHYANSMINTCALCGQCGAVCPNGLDMRQVFGAARERMVQTRKMPPSAFEFGLLDMEYSLSEAFYLARHQSGHGTSAYLFFPGCQLAASEPELVPAVYRDLTKRLAGGVGLLLACCGIMAKWAGENAQFEAVRRRLTGAWEGLGRPLVIAGCPTCADTLRHECGIKTESLFETLERLGKTPVRRPGGPACLHDACGARYDEAQQDSVRRLANQCGLDLTMSPAGTAKSPCCGYGGLTGLVSREVAGQITRTALEQLTPATSPVLTYCVNCRDRYLAAGRSAWHILELYYPRPGAAPTGPPTWSQRRDNRTAVKDEMLKEFWQEMTERKNELVLYITEELTRKLEATHILKSDIAAVIAQAEATGSKLIDAETGHYTASYRPRNVTFWVEYSPQGSGWQVHNAYSHRMDFILDDQLTEGRGDENGGI